MNESTPLLLKALNKEKLPIPPIWYMRPVSYTHLTLPTILLV